MSINTISDLYLTYSFLKRLTTPFEKWNAYKTGVIDDKGNILVKSSERTSEQKNSLSYFDTIILNLKKILSKVPGGSSNFASYSAALFLLKENYDPETLEEDFLNYLSETLDEDAPVNSVGTGHIAGANDDPFKNTFAGHKVFNVNSDTVWKNRFGKKKHQRWNKTLADDPLAPDITDYAKKNPKSSIVLKDHKTGAMIFLRRRPF